MQIFKILSLALVAGSAISTMSLTANAGSSVWNHNGSQMLLQSNGNQRTLSYLYPRPGISARRGDIVFEGRRVGNRYVGTAYTFRSGCHPAPYEVSGQLRSETRIVLHGASPRRSGCAVIGYTNRSSNSRLVFSYMRRGGGGQGYVPERARPQVPEGPAYSAPRTIVKRIPGGKVYFKIQDQDAPAQTPIRIDVTARCNNGQRVRLRTNLRTCRFDGVRTLGDGSGFSMSMMDFGGGSCSQPNMERVQTYDACR